MSMMRRPIRQHSLQTLVPQRCLRNCLHFCAWAGLPSLPKPSLEHKSLTAASKSICNLTLHEAWPYTAIASLAIVQHALCKACINLT